MARTTTRREELVNEEQRKIGKKMYEDLVSTGSRTEMARALKSTMEIIEAQDEQLEKLAQQGKPLAVVVEIHEDTMVVAQGGTSIKVNKGSHVAEIGDTAELVAQSFQVVAVSKNPYPCGVACSVRAVHERRVEVEIGGMPRVVHTQFKHSVGDRVIVDQSMHAVLGCLGKQASVHKFSMDGVVTWDDIGGQEDAKAALKEALELPFENKELYAKYGMTPPKGVLLYGPPGTGKTMLAKAAATSLAKTHGESAKGGLIYVKGPALLSKWVGDTEQAIRELFITAREHKKTHGYPALVFIDEADAVLGKRGGETSGARFMAGTVVPQFLSEMDGLEDSGAMVLLATNRPDTLDPAVVREGRVDRKVRVTRPQREDALAITNIHLRGRPTKDAELVAEKVVHELYRTDRVVAESNGVYLTLGGVCSGAMIASVVERATTKALKRDVESKRKTASGITLGDVQWAVDKIQEGLQHLDHTDAFVEELDNQRRM